MSSSEVPGVAAKSWENSVIGAGPALSPEMVHSALEIMLFPWNEPVTTATGSLPTTLELLASVGAVGAVAVTVTTNIEVDVLPAESVAVTVTVVGPTGNVLPEGG